MTTTKKNKGGRPKSDNPKGRTMPVLQVAFPADLEKRLRSLAAEKGVPVSTFVRSLVVDALSRLDKKRKE